MPEIKYGKVTTYDQDDNGNTTIDTESYHDGISAVKQEVEQNIRTTNSTLLADVIGCLGEVKEGTTREMVITIKSGRDYTPYLITKRFTTNHEVYKPVRKTT